MWRALSSLFALLLTASLLFPVVAAAQDDGGFQCITCDEACAREHGLEPGERLCTGPEGVQGTFSDDETFRQEPATGPAATNSNDAPEPAGPPSFLLGLVQWTFTPIVDVIGVDGAVAPQDVKNTVEADLEAIFHCFHPGLRYPGGGSIDVDVHLSYNGVPVAVNGSTDGILPGQARCILRRAWNYEFPRIAERGDQPSHLRYSITFEPNRRGVPDTDPRRPQLLLERVAVADAALQPEIAAALYGHLSSAERCAAIGLEDLPSDLLVIEVAMRWRQGDGALFPADVDITAVNKTGTQMPSVDFLQCLETTLSVWDLPELDGDHPRHEAAFFLTIRPAGWYGS